MLLLIAGLVWLVVIPAVVLGGAWALAIIRERRPVEDRSPVLIISLAALTGRAHGVVPACAHRVALGRTARRRRCTQAQQHTGLSSR